MKKAIVLVIALIGLCSCDKTSVETTDKTAYVPLNDTQLINKYVNEEFGNGYYGVQYDHCDGDEFVEFRVYDDKDKCVRICSINRDFHQPYKNS